MDGLSTLRRAALRPCPVRHCPNLRARYFCCNACWQRLPEGKRKVVILAFSDMRRDFGRGYDAARRAALDWMNADAEKLQKARLAPCLQESKKAHTERGDS